MRKADLVNTIAEKTKIPKVDVLVVVESFFQEVKDAMADGQNVYIRGFGSFIIKRRAKKVGRDIKKNQSIDIPEHFIPSFKPAPVFMDHVRDNVKQAPADESED
jgi:DNA-binding protein HU-beta